MLGHGLRVHEATKPPRAGRHVSDDLDEVVVEGAPIVFLHQCFCCMQLNEATNKHAREQRDLRRSRPTGVGWR
jgi:hypothetical protein